MRLILILLFIPSLLFAGDYNRNDWGRWSDEDGDCYDLRHEILAEKSLVLVTYKNDCMVDTGLWKDEYTGIYYRNASDLDIDHVVPLRHSFDNGAMHWSREKKQQFFNDPINLVITRDRVNQSKGSKDVTEWLPPLHSKKCWYSARWVMVKVTYDLSFSNDEILFLRDLMEEC